MSHRSLLIPWHWLALFGVRTRTQRAQIGVGYRSLVKAGDARRLGIYGFGAAAHIVVQVARHQGREVYAFTRPGDAAAQQFAMSFGAAWAGDSTSPPPEPLDAAIIFAPAGQLVPQALRAVTKGGTVVCGGIHLSDIPSFPYRILWEERSVCSVANLTRHDGEEFPCLLTAGLRVQSKGPFCQIWGSVFQYVRVGIYTR